MTNLLEQSMKTVKTVVNRSLGFLDNFWVRVIIAALIILYIIGGIPMLTGDIASIFHNPIVKLLFLALIIYIGIKDIPLALLLALAFVLSLQMGYSYQFGTQFGASQQGITTGADVVAGPANISVKAGLSNPFAPSVEGMIGDQSTEDPVKGGNYNKYFDCVKDCAENDLGTGALNSPCRAVGVWTDELNAQGLNCPLGFSGQKRGAPF